MAIEKMYDWLNERLMEFRSCFTREATFKWFVIIVIGMMAKQDHLGITSIIRGLDIAPIWYETMLHFFRSNAWRLDTITQLWTRTVASSGWMFLEDDMPILVGDGVKGSKEARRMP